MSGLEQAVQAIEHGLMPVQGADHSAKHDLSQRMVHYKVPGVSVAFVYEEALA